MGLAAGPETGSGRAGMADGGLPGPLPDDIPLTAHLPRDLGVVVGTNRAQCRGRATTTPRSRGRCQRDGSVVAVVVTAPVAAVVSTVTAPVAAVVVTVTAPVTAVVVTVPPVVHGQDPPAVTRPPRDLAAVVGVPAADELAGPPDPVADALGAVVAGEAVAGLALRARGGGGRDAGARLRG